MAHRIVDLQESFARLAEAGPGASAAFTPEEFSELHKVYAKGHRAGLFLTYALTFEGYRDHEMKFEVIPKEDQRPCLVFSKNACSGTALYNCMEIPARQWPHLWTPRFGIALARLSNAVERMAKASAFKPQRHSQDTKSFLQLVG